MVTQDWRGEKVSGRTVLINGRRYKQPHPITPHVPDEPTSEEVRALLRQMEFAICYYEQDQRPVPSQPHDPPGSTRYELTPVMGICWLADRGDSDVITVYIDGKPFAVNKDWLPDDERKRLYGD